MSSVVELPDIRQSSTKVQTRSQRKIDNSKYAKKAVIMSVDKLVRKNDLQSVIGYDNDYYPKQLEDQKRIDETAEVHANLTELKRSCDSLKLTGTTKEREMDKMRREIDSMILQIDQYDVAQKLLKEQDTQMQERVDQQLKLLTDSQMTRKVYEQMLARMKNDHVVYILRANEYERILTHGQQTLNIETYKYQQIKELYSKTRAALDEVTGGIEQQNHNREKNLERFKEDLKHKQEMELKREERIKRQQEIAEVAANDIKDSSLKKWRKLLLVHKFLNSFLKNKMQSGIQQYSHLEIAFQKIKASTGVMDAGEIVQKFLGRESTYAHLLISISDYEKRIDGLKADNHELTATINKLKQEFTDMDKELLVESHKVKDDLQDQDKLVAEVEEKAIQSNLLSNKLHTWIKRNIKKLGLPENKASFNSIVDVLRERLLSLSQAQQADLMNNSIEFSAKDIYDPEFQKRNIRVKPKRVVQLHTNQSHEMSRDEDDFLEDIPSKDEDREDEEEERLLRQLRQDVKFKSGGK